MSARLAFYVALGALLGALGALVLLGVGFLVLTLAASLLGDPGALWRL